MSSGFVHCWQSLCFAYCICLTPALSDHVCLHLSTSWGVCLYQNSNNIAASGMWDLSVVRVVYKCPRPVLQKQIPRHLGSRGSDIALLKIPAEPSLKMIALEIETPVNEQIHRSHVSIGYLLFINIIVFPCYWFSSWARRSVGRWSFGKAGAREANFGS